jgi:hypothetical protein
VKSTVTHHLSADFVSFEEIRVLCQTDRFHAKSSRVSTPLPCHLSRGRASSSGPGRMPGQRRLLTVVTAPNTSGLFPLALQSAARFPLEWYASTTGCLTGDRQAARVSASRSTNVPVPNHLFPLVPPSKRANRGQKLAVYSQSTRNRPRPRLQVGGSGPPSSSQQRREPTTRTHIIPPAGSRVSARATVR